MAAWEDETRPIKWSHKGANHKEVPIQHAWNELQALHSHGLLKLTHESSNNPNEYRLTDEGWDESNIDVPDTPELTEDAREN